MSDSADVELGTLAGGTTVVAASRATAVAKLTERDVFVQQQSPFDRQARLCLTAEVVTVTEAMYLQYVSAQAMDWSPAQVAALRQIVSSVAAKLAPLQISLPSRVVLVLTTGKEEGYAAYTRNLDTVVLPANMVASLSDGASFDDPLHAAPSTDYLEGIVVHELFHLVSKNDPELRARLYGEIGYRILPEPVELPATPWPDAAGTPMRDLKITNPDAALLDVAIDLHVPPPGGGPETVRPLLPVLVSSAPYVAGSFFDTLQWRFLAVEESHGSWVPTLHDGLPVVYQPEALMAQYLEKVGANFANEIFHPDEILAQSFVLLANQPSTGLLDRLGRSLRH
jgi:hypothetical protein